MKEFERFLSDLPKPVVDVRRFRDRLGRVLRHAEQMRRDRRRRRVLHSTAATAVGLAAVLVLFVVKPQIPRSIHDRVLGAPARSVDLTADSPGVPVEADRAFIERWTANQEHPVEVRSIESERVFSVRQFELTDGKRMLVFSEIGDEEPNEPAALRATAAARVF